MKTVEMPIKQAPVPEKLPILKEKGKKKDRIICGLLLSFIFINLAVLPIFWKTYKEKQKEKIQIAKAEIATTTISASTFFQDLKLEARAFIVYDPETERVIFGQEENVARPLASLTKVMTVLTASELTPMDKTQVIIDEEALAEEGESGLQPNSAWNLKNLADFTLVVSSNDGAKAIANTVASVSSTDFVQEMNKRAGYLGLASVNFFNETGLDLSSGGAGAYGSPRDIARLFSYLLKNKSDLLAATSQNRLTGISPRNNYYSVSNTNLLANKIPGLLASKTGYTESAGGNLAVAVNLGLRRPMVFVVMGSSPDGRFNDMEKLIIKTQEYLAQTAGQY